MTAIKVEPNYRILVIDDNPSIHEDFRKILHHSQAQNRALEESEAALFGEPISIPEPVRFEIDSAYQGSAGLALVEQAIQAGRPYALAFVDVRMPPGWDGIETVAHIWKRYPELQVVICTAHSDYSWDEMTRQLGPSDSLVILKKPFDNIEVMQLAHALTKKWLLAKQDKVRLADLDDRVRQRTQELQTANAKLQQEIFIRAQVEAALRLSEERFEKAFVTSPIPMAIQAFKDERYLDVNESYVHLINVPRDQIIGHSPEDLCGGIDQASRLEVRRQLQNKMPVRGLEGQMHTPCGEARQILLFVESFNLGAEPYMLVLAQDISERLSLENQLRHAQKMEAVGQLAAGIAHDFNNLLTIIQGHVGLLITDQNLEPDIAESLREISTASKRAARLTHQLLAFSRKQVIQLRALDLNDLLINLSSMLKRLVEENITLRCDLAPGLPLIHVDSGNLEQVVMNLVVNARDAMPGGGTVTLHTAAVVIGPENSTQNQEAHAGTFVCLSVEDTGCGMDAATQGHIFEPFFTTKEVGKGTGMGLATVYGIVKQHAGWIEVESQVGTGSIFKVFLPVCQTAPEAETPRETIENTDGVSAVPKGHQTIMVVEDEPALRDLVRVILQEYGYHVVTANNGVEALDLWQELKGEVDLLLTDMVMPEGMSGQRLAEQLHEEKAQLKVIISSGYGKELTSDKVSLPNGFKFLSKPYDPQKLTQAVQECLDA